jgi:threonine dehydratase
MPAANPAPALPRADAAVLPGYADVLAAAARIAPHAHATPVLRSRTLDDILGFDVFFKAEHLQRGGAFKFRGACNAVWALDDHHAARGVVTHSSGNHGAALALAARTRGIACHVVVPEGAVRSKLAAIEAYGATLHGCAPTIAAREARCAEVQARTGAVLVHPYTDFQVIAGQGTAALELLNHCDNALDAVVVPVGGGGLASGTALALAALAPHARLLLAEPSGAAETAASLARGARVTEFTPATVCDGLRGTLGAPNFALLQAHAAEVLTVDDAETIAAMRLLWTRTKQLVEPSSATVLAALLKHRGRFRGQRIGAILSGGNVDLDALPALFAT